MRLSSLASLFPSGVLLDAFMDSRDGSQYHNDFDFGFRYVRKVNLFYRQRLSSRQIQRLQINSRSKYPKRGQQRDRCTL